VAYARDARTETSAERAPSFGIRGIKGWAWSPAQYLDIIPWLPTVRFNFLMNCYASVCDIEHYEWGQLGCNRWWEPLPDTKARAFEDVVRACQDVGVDFCFSMNPNLFSVRFARVDRASDVDALWAHYRWMQSLGVRWFNVALDDVGLGTDAAGQVRLVNELLRRLRLRDKGARMVFCPTIYWGDASRPGDLAYLHVVNRDLDPEVLVFWTGDAVVTSRITSHAARGYREAIGHSLIVWDNYPVDDDRPTMHLGPLTGRDPDLADVAVGYISNPMRRQDQLNRLALSTAADYAFDSAAYDPDRSIRRAIDRLAKNREQRAILADLVAVYPGMLAFGENQYFNPVRDRFAGLLETNPDEAGAFLAAVRGLSTRFSRAFADGCAAERQTIEADLVWMETRINNSQG
jgi:hypothetical protein